MNLKRTQNWRALLVIFVTLLIVCETLAYVVTTPRPNEQFFQFYLLGSKRAASDYYPNNDADIRPDVPVSWVLGVTNNMGSIQLLSVRVKIGNQTIQPPDDQNAVASPAPFLSDFARVLQDNETWEIPFVWTIRNATITAASARIVTFQINNETYEISDWSAKNGYNFRLVFELWTWQTDLGSFEFGWTTNGERHVAWLQVWFNMTSAAT